MGALIQIPGGATPVERILSRFDRAQLEGFIAVAIDLLDVADGDVDIEPNGDELDSTGAEDDFIDHGPGHLRGPGCPIADEGGDPLDAGEEDQGLLMPEYGVDQTLGPINEAKAVAEHRAKELGLERSPTGGWRRKAQ